MTWDGIWRAEGGALTYKGNSGVSNPTPVLSGHFPVPTTSGPGSPHIWSGLGHRTQAHLERPSSSCFPGLHKAHYSLPSMHRHTKNNGFVSYSAQSPRTLFSSSCTHTSLYLAASSLLAYPSHPLHNSVWDYLCPEV